MKTAIFLIVLSLTSLTVQAETMWPGEKSALQGVVHERLQGCWQNTVSAIELPEMAREENAGPQGAETATLQYQFRENGAFVRSIDHGTTHVEEHGRYEVSADGRFVLLYFPGKEVEKAAIKYIELDEMVLEQPLRIPGSPLSMENRQIFFNKV